MKPLYSIDQICYRQPGSGKGHLKKRAWHRGDRVGIRIAKMPTGDPGIFRRYGLLNTRDYVWCFAGKIGNRMIDYIVILKVGLNIWQLTSLQHFDKML